MESRTRLRTSFCCRTSCPCSSRVYSSSCCSGNCRKAVGSAVVFVVAVEEGSFYASNGGSMELRTTRTRTRTSCCCRTSCRCSIRVCSSSCCCGNCKSSSSSSSCSSSWSNCTRNWYTGGPIILTRGTWPLAEEHVFNNVPLSHSTIAEFFLAFFQLAIQCFHAG